jgi:Fic family protein
MNLIKYAIPRNWLNYRISEIIQPLTEAKAAVRSLVKVPFQRSWIEALQVMQLKREVAGTSRIEGADFTEKELEAALKQTPEQMLTRSQKQARAAMNAYKWIADLPEDRPITLDLIKEVHELIIGDADIDHCAPGQVRKKGDNVVFGIPIHRGCEGGDECEQSLNELGVAVQHDFRAHDQLIQALALHYHFAAMHPFQDGNGRTARAVEALMLQRSGLTDHLFIAMSNYYYDQKPEYLKALSQVGPPDYDLTPFIIFGLKGIEVQCDKLFDEIRKNVLKTIFRETMYDLYAHLETKRKRVIKERHTGILKLLLEIDEIKLTDFFKRIDQWYSGLRQKQNAMIRDLNYLLRIEAVKYRREGSDYVFSADLMWPTRITESGFLDQVKKMPTAKTITLVSQYA